jgi:hypothetical protein
LPSSVIAELSRNSLEGEREEFFVFCYASLLARIPAPGARLRWIACGIGRLSTQSSHTSRRGERCGSDEYKYCSVSETEFSDIGSNVTPARWTPAEVQKGNRRTRLEIILSKVIDRWLKAVSQFHLCLPPELCFGQRNVWPALSGVILRQRHVDELWGRSSLFQNEFGKLPAW